MHSYTELPIQFEALNRSSKELAKDLLNALTPSERGRTLSARSDHSSLLVSPESKVIVITEGSLLCRSADRDLYQCDEGDIVGFWNVSAEANLGMHTDFAVIGDVYDLRAIEAQLLGSAKLLATWNQFLALQVQLVSTVLAAASGSTVRFSPTTKQYESGVTVLQQGDPSGEVFTLLKGACDVFVDGQRIGEILADEIFGAVAVLTNRPRTATVVTREPSTIMSVPGELFFRLIEGRPATTLKLLQDLCRALVATNSRLASGL